MAREGGRALEHTPSVGVSQASPQAAPSAGAAVVRAPAYRGERSPAPGRTLGGASRALTPPTFRRPRRFWRNSGDNTGVHNTLLQQIAQKRFRVCCVFNDCAPFWVTLHVQRCKIGSSCFPSGQARFVPGYTNRSTACKVGCTLSCMNTAISKHTASLVLSSTKSCFLINPFASFINSLFLTTCKRV
jgi:hypothetical protein